MRAAAGAEARQCRATAEGPAAAALPDPLTKATVIPAGQRCSRQLRHYFLTAAGPSCTIDAHPARSPTDAPAAWRIRRGKPVEARGPL